MKIIEKEIVCNIIKEKIYSIRKWRKWKIKKLRVWWLPQIGIKELFHVSIETLKEGKKVLELLAAYDTFQLQNRIKGDYCNTGGIQMWDEEEQEWNDWYIETEDDYFDDVDVYFEQCGDAEEIATYTKELFEQIDRKKIERMMK